MISLNLIYFEYLRNLNRWFILINWRITMIQVLFYYLQKMLLVFQSEHHVSHLQEHIAIINVITLHFKEVNLLLNQSHFHQDHKLKRFQTVLFINALNFQQLISQIVNILQLSNNVHFIHAVL